GMLPPVVVHIDPGDCGLGPLEGRFGDRVAVPDERDDAPIVIRVHFGVEKANTGDGRDRFCDGIHDLFASPLRKVRDTLHDVCHSFLRGSAEGPNSLKDRKSTRLNSSHEWISYAVFCLKKKNRVEVAGKVASLLVSPGAQRLIELEAQARHRFYLVPKAVAHRDNSLAPAERKSAVAAYG